MFKNYEASDLSVCFLLFFFWGNDWLFEKGILVSLFNVEFWKVLKQVLNLNNDESVSTEQIKNGFILHFNHLNGYWSSSQLSQLKLFKVLVFGKVCFNGKPSVFCFISFFLCSIIIIIIIFLFFFGFSFLLSLILPKGNFSHRFGLGLGLGLVLRGDCPQRQLS